MAYLKATEILPESLLEILQEYAAGQLIYIPNRKGTRRNWGATTDTRQWLAARNDKIICDHQKGVSVRELAARYHLAESTVKKIVYTRKKLPG